MCYERTVLNSYCQCVTSWVEPCSFYQQHALEHNIDGVCINVEPTLETRDGFCPACITGPIEPGLSFSARPEKATRKRPVKYTFEEKVILSSNVEKKKMAKGGRFRAIFKNIKINA